MLRCAFIAALCFAATPAFAQAPSDALDEVSTTRGETDGWPDLSSFLDEKYGFLPLVFPITEPAVGYGAVAGVAFISKPLGAARDGFGRPNLSFVGPYRAKCDRIADNEYEGFTISTREGVRA